MASHYYSRLYYHVILRTRCRRKMITAQNEATLHHALRHTVEQMGATFVVLNGVEDHVHMLIAIGVEHDLRKLIRRAKQVSARAIDEPESRFVWGRGYALFTVSPYDYKGLIRYIRGQKAHHRSGLTERRHEW